MVTFFVGAIVTCSEVCNSGIVIKTGGKGVYGSGGKMVYCYQFYFESNTLYILTVYRVSQEECVRLREGVPYVKVYRYNPKPLCPNLNGYGDNGQRCLKL